MSTAEPTIMSESPAVSNEFDYTPMSPFAPISVILAMFGLVAFYHVYGVLVALLAANVALIAVMKIKKSEGAIGGTAVAMMALVISGLTVTASAAMYSFNYANECPEGYDRHNFPKEIAAKQFSWQGRTRLIHPEVEPLLEKPIFIKGYVYQTRSTRSQRDFILLKDSGDCCFGGDPAAYDMILVTLEDDQPPVDFPMLSQVSVAGVLSADPSAPDGLPVYTMKAVKCESAWTSF